MEYSKAKRFLFVYSRIVLLLFLRFLACCCCCCVCCCLSAVVVQIIYGFIRQSSQMCVKLTYVHQSSTCTKMCSCEYVSAFFFLFFQNNTTVLLLLPLCVLFTSEFAGFFCSSYISFTHVDQLAVALSLSHTITVSRLHCSSSRAWCSHASCSKFFPFDWRMQYSKNWIFEFKSFVLYFWPGSVYDTLLLLSQSQYTRWM